MLLGHYTKKEVIVKIFFFGNYVFYICSVTLQTETTITNGCEILRKKNKTRINPEVMAIPNVDKLYECGSALSAAKAGEFPKVRI